MLLRIKDYTTKVGSGVTPRGGAETYLDKGIPLFRSQNVANDGFLMDDIAFISEDVDESMKGTRVKSGDVLLNITGASIGRCYYTSDDFERGNVNQHVCIIRPKRNKVNPAFLHYCFISDQGQQQIDLTQTGANREGLSIEDINGFTFDIPSLYEQQRIVDYLDEKLSNIDSRIAVLEKQKDAYARLKKSIIHQAVTRGLNPNVPLKDSGVDWIGMIPEHWEIKRMKDIFSTYSTGLTPESKIETNFSEDDRYTWVTIGDMDSKVVNTSNMCLSEKVIKEKAPIISPKGSLLFSFKLSIGKTAFAGKDLYTNEAIVTIPPRKTIDLNYFYYIIPKVCLENATENIYGAKMLNQKIIANMLFAIPSFSEQQAIANYLDEKCAKIDAAVENIGKQIDASKRLKRALINEVITGQRAV